MATRVYTVIVMQGSRIVTKCQNGVISENGTPVVRADAEALDALGDFLKRVAQVRLLESEKEDAA